MSIFGSLSKAITSNYFRDEFGLPLPQRSMVKSKATPTQPIELDDSWFTKVVFNEMKNGIIKCMRMAESRESKHGAMALAPIFDGLLCFESFVISNFSLDDNVNPSSR